MRYFKKGFLVWAAFLFFSSMNVLADQRMNIISVDEAGVMELSDGRKVELEGVTLGAEAADLLRVLAVGKPALVYFENSIVSQSVESAAPMKGFVEVEAITTSFENMNQNYEWINLNQFVISTGAASVDETRDFRDKNYFLEIQSSAEKSGQGIWSYEVEEGAEDKSEEPEESYEEQ